MSDTIAPDRERSCRLMIDVSPLSSGCMRQKLKSPQSFRNTDHYYLDQKSCSLESIQTGSSKIKFFSRGTVVNCAALYSESATDIPSSLPYEVMSAIEELKDWQRCHLSGYFRGRTSASVCKSSVSA